MNTFRQSHLRVLTVFLAIFASVYFAAPSFVHNKSFLAYFPSTRINLGLDLKGGVSILLNVDVAAYISDKLDAYIYAVRNNLLNDELANHQESGYNIYKDADNIIISSKLKREIGDKVSDFKDKTVEALDKVLGYNNYQITEQNNDSLSTLTVSLSSEYVKQLKDAILEQSIEIVRRRIDESGTKEIDVQKQGADSILLQIPGTDNVEDIYHLLGKTAKLSFHFVNENINPKDIQDGLIPLGNKLLFFQDSRGDKKSENSNSEESKVLEASQKGPNDKSTLATDASRNRKEYPVVLYSKSIIVGDMLTNAITTTHEGKYAVNFTLNQMGAEIFAHETANNIGKALAIVLDDKVISIAVINSAIQGGDGVISGNFTAEEASQLSLLLRSGALPAKLNIAEERVIGPTLGKESIEAGKKATIYSFIAIAIFMIFFYRIWGVLAVFALAINIISIIAIITVLGATLTLPGIAGIVLTIGMSVDANVLIFERIKEELRNGRKKLESIKTGYHAAFGTILDSNLTTIIAVLILYIFSNGPIRGFSIALIIGVLSSMFTSVFCTQTIAWLFLNRKQKISR